MAVARTSAAARAAATSSGDRPAKVAVQCVASPASWTSGKLCPAPARRSPRPPENGSAAPAVMRASRPASASAVLSGAVAVPCTSTVSAAVCTAGCTVIACAVEVSEKPEPETFTVSPGRMSGVASVQHPAAPALTDALPVPSVVTVASPTRTPLRRTSTRSAAEAG